MAQNLFSQIALQTLGGIGPSAAPGQPAVGGGDDPVSAIFQVAQERGIDPTHLLGLAKLETRAGEATIKGGGSDTRNLFNVKDFSKAGNGIRARDNAEGSNDRYRQYASYRESAEDLVGLLERKYPAALKARSPEEFAQALKQGGYATDPLYERKLANTIRSSLGGLASVRPMQPTQEWDQGARYIPMDLMLSGTDKPQPAEKPKEGAGFWEGTADVGLAAAQGVVGSVKAITDLAGADNAVSRSLDDASKGIEKTKSDASQADRKYHQQKIREAEASGDWKDEVAAYANMVWDMPLESLAQGIGSFATLGAGKVAQMAKLASAAKKAGVTKEAFLKTAQGVEAAKQASNLGAKVNVGLGVGQGIGGVKGSQYEQTFNAAKESGLSDEQAQALATEAQSYQQGWGQQLVGAGLGYLAGKTGPIEKLASGQTVGAGGVARRFIGGGLVEAGTEGLQGGQERYAGNAAAIDAGVLDESKRWAGVAGSGTSEAITAGILGGGAGALGRPDVDPQAQAKAAAQKSGGIVSRAGLAATPGAQQPAGQTGQAPAGSATAAPAQPTSVSAAPNPNFADMDDEGLKVLGEYLTTRQAMTDGTPISDEDRKVGQEALAELARRQAAATASPAPAVSQNAIQASALSAIEQALQADQQRRRAAGEVVDDDVTDVEVKAPAQPAAKPPLGNEPDPMLPQAIDFLRQGGKPSVSAVQRQFRIGFNRAARLLEDMQRDGIVGPMDEQGARQILKLPDPPDGQANTPAQPAPSAGFSLPAFDNSPIPKTDPASADEQRRQAAEFEQKRKNRRAATRASVWERNPFLGFLGANGINRDVANEFAPGLVEKRKAFVPGYGPVFRAGAKNLDELVQNAKEDGFLREDDDTPELYDLIERALRGERIAPLYADGAAEAEGQRHQRDIQEREGATFEDYLQQAEGDDFDPFPLMADSGYDAQDLAGTDFDQADDAVRAEVAALAAQYGDLGFDPADVLETLAIETENQPEQNYYERARTRLSDLISQAYAQAQPGSNRAVRADRAEPLPAGEAGARGPADGQQVAPAAPTPKLSNVDELAAEGFNRVVKQGDKTYFVNPDTRESVELDSPAQIARARARVQAKQRLGNLRGTRPQDFALDAVTPEALKARDEQAQAAQSQQTSEQQAAAAQAKADDERRRIEQASYAAADSFELGQNPLDSLTGQQDIFGAAPSPVAQDLAGERINDEWTAFDPQSGTLGIPRAQMPQIKAEHRGAMMGFLKARGINGQQETIPSAAIKPTQAEFSPAKVRQAIDYQGGNRSIIVSADGYVVDGHHQWLAAREKGEPIPAIRLDQNIGDVLAALKDMPSAQPASSSGSRGPSASQAWKNEGKSPADLIAEKAQSAGRELAVQVSEESREQDFRPSEIPQAVEQWAADAIVPADDLKRILLQELPSLGVSNARIQQIRAALYPVLKDAARDYESDMRLYPSRVLEQVGANGELAKLYAKAGVRGADAFGGLSADDRAAAYAAFVADGGKPAGNLPQSYNDSVMEEERQIRRRQLQGERTITQANGKPFKTEAGAKAMLDEFDLGGTHKIVSEGGGYALRQMPPAEQAEVRRKADGRESYMEAQAAVITEMGIPSTADGEIDATDEQWDEIDQRIAERLGRAQTDAAKPAASEQPAVQPNAGPQSDDPIASRPFATVIEKTKTGWKIVGDPDALAEHARDIFGKGVVKRKDGISLATKTDDVAGNFPARFDEYRLADLPERHGRIEVRVNQDGSASVRSMDGGYMGPQLPSVAEAIANHRKEFGDGEAMPATSEQPNAAPAKTQAETRKGEVGMKLESGEQVLTNTSRKTTPFPKVSLDTNRKAINTLKLVDRWLMQNALDEARSRGDDFNARQFEANLEKPQQADKDAAEEYLFGDYIPKVVPSTLKPLATENRKPAGREGYDTPVELDAAQLKAILEQTRGEPLVGKPAKLEAWRNGTAKTDPAKFPIELFLTTDGRLDVNDGRHRIALAAERGEKVTAFIDGKDAQRAKDLLAMREQQTAASGAVDLDLEAIFDQLDGLTQRTQANGQRAAAAHPQAERIQFVQKHILDILQDLEDTGKVSINC